jgi:hypothetical protein
MYRCAHNQRLLANHALERFEFLRWYARMRFTMDQRHVSPTNIAFDHWIKREHVAHSDSSVSKRRGPLMLGDADKMLAELKSSPRWERVHGAKTKPRRSGA